MEIFQKYISKARERHKEKMEEMVHNKKKKKKLIYNFQVDGQKYAFAMKSLYLFTPKNPFRLIMVKIMVSKTFRFLMIMFVTIQTVLLCLKDYKGRINQEVTNPRLENFINTFEVVFMIIYWIEGAIKIIAMGFVRGQGTYLKQPMNWIDFFVIVFGLFTTAISSERAEFVSIIPMLRLVKPMRLLGRFSKVQIIIKALTASLKSIWNIMLMLLIFCLVYAGMGLNVFIGQLDYRCRVTPEPPASGIWQIAPGTNYICGHKECPEGTYCRNLENYRQTDDIFNTFELNYGMTNFDNIFYSMISVFELLIGEGWVEILYMYWNGLHPAYCSIMFYSCFFIGNILLINLFLGVINYAFDKVVEENNKKEQKKKEKAEKKKKEEEERKKKEKEERDKLIQIDDLDDSALFSLNKNEEKKEEEVKKGKEPFDEMKLIKMLEDRKTKTKSSVVRFCIKAIFNKYFGLARVILILGTSIVISLDSNRSSETQSERLTNANFFFNFLFIIESIIVTIAHGCSLFFWKDKLVLFDKVINICVIIEFILYNRGMDPKGIFIKLLSLIRVVRVFRLISIVQAWSSIRRLLLTSIQSIKDMKDFLILLFIYLTCVSLTSTEFFAYKILVNPKTNIVYNGEDSYDGFDSPRLNFDNFSSSFISNFAIIGLDQWTYIMHDAYRAMKSPSVSLYFIIVVIIGNLILLNLFLAILINNFIEAEDREVKVMKKSLVYSLEHFSTKKPVDPPAVRQDVTPGISRMGENSIDEEINGEQVIKKSSFHPQNDIRNDEMNELNRFASNSGFRMSDSRVFPQDSVLQRKIDQHAREKRKRKEAKKLAEEKQIFKMPPPDENYDEFLFPGSKKKRKEEDRRLESASRESLLLSQSISRLRRDTLRGSARGGRSSIVLDIRNFMSSELAEDFKGKKESICYRLFTGYKKETKELQEEILFGTSLNLFKRHSCFRLFLFNVYSSNFYFIFINTISIITPIFMALKDPAKSNSSGLNRFINFFAFFSGWSFVTQMLIEIVLFGFYKNGGRSYFKVPLNVFEFVLNMLFIAGNFHYLQALKSVIAFRMIRIFIILKWLTKNDKVILVMNSLIESLPAIFRLVFVEFLLFFFLSVLNVNLFKGTFFFCDTVNVPEAMREMVLTKKDCIDLGGDWVNAVLSFDHIATSMMLIFQLVTAEGWTHIMFQAMDSRGEDQQKSKDANFYVSFYFIFLIVVANFLILNFFAGVVIETFSKEKAKKGGYFLLSKSQRKWVDIHTIILKFSPKSRFVSPKTPWRKKLYYFLQKKSFKAIEFFLIISSCFPYLMIHHNSSAGYDSFLNVIFVITYVIFIFEVIFKLVAFGLQGFKKTSIQFDLVVIFFEIVSISLGAIWPGFITNYPTLFKVMKSLRILRLAKLGKYIKGNTVIMDIIKIALPMLLNLLIMLTCLIFVYAVIGMHIFPYIKWRKGINSNANFTTFFLAFLTLLRMSTVEGWDTLLRDCLRVNRPNDICFPMMNYEEFEKHGSQYLGCGNNYSYFYFLTFMIIFVYLLTNLVSAIIIETFFLRTRLANSRVNMKEIKRFVKTWQKYDKNGIGIMHWNKAKKMLQDIPPPLGINKKNANEEVMSYLMKKLKVPLWKRKEDGTINLYFYDLLLCIAKHSFKAEEEFKDIEDVKVKMHLDLDRIKKIKEKALEKEYIRINFTTKDLEFFFPFKMMIIDRLAKRNQNFSYLVKKAQDLGNISEQSSVFSDSSDGEIFEDRRAIIQKKRNARRGVIFIPQNVTRGLKIPNEGNSESLRSHVSSIESDSESIDKEFEKRLSIIQKKRESLKKKKSGESKKNGIPSEFDFENLGRDNNNDTNPEDKDTNLTLTKAGERVIEAKPNKFDSGSGNIYNNNKNVQKFHEILKEQNNIEYDNLDKDITQTDPIKKKARSSILDLDTGWFKEQNKTSETGKLDRKIDIPKTRSRNRKKTTPVVEIKDAKVSKRSYDSDTDKEPEAKTRNRNISEWNLDMYERDRLSCLKQPSRIRRADMDDSLDMEMSRRKKSRKRRPPNRVIKPYKKTISYDPVIGKAKVTANMNYLRSKKRSNLTRNRGSGLTSSPKPQVFINSGEKIRPFDKSPIGNFKDGNSVDNALGNGIRSKSTFERSRMHKKNRYGSYKDFSSKERDM